MHCDHWPLGPPLLTVKSFFVDQVSKATKGQASSAMVNE
jgi:hypothetical protein